MLLLAAAPSCTAYKSDSVAFASVGTNFGLTTDEGVSNAGGLSGATNSSTKGQRQILSTENNAQPSIAFADGTVITGTVDQTSGLREIGNALKNLATIAGLRSIWGTGLKEAGDTARKALQN